MNMTQCANSPSKAPNEGDKFVEVVRSEPGDQGAEEHNEEPEEVLLPLDKVVLLAGADEQAVLENSRRREDLERDGKQDGHGVEELNLRVAASVGEVEVVGCWTYRLHDLARGVEVDQDVGLNLGAESEVAERASTTEED